MMRLIFDERQVVQEDRQIRPAISHPVTPYLSSDVFVCVWQKLGWLHVKTNWRSLAGVLRQTMSLFMAIMIVIEQRALG
jgi:hypothetical protein